MTDKPKRRWLQFSLRTLFVVVTVFCVWMGIIAKQARDQKQAVEMIRDMGGMVLYQYQVDQFQSSRVILVTDKTTDLPFPRPPGPEWLRRIVGDEYFFTVASIYLDGPHFTDASLLVAGQLTDAKFLRLDNTQITDAGLVNVKGLTNLQMLSLGTTQVTEEGVKQLQQSLPNCRIHRSP